MSPDIKFDKNPALQVATVLYLFERKGYTEVFVPVYSTKLANFLPLIVQLMHESFCKSGKGMTFYGDMGPESQHHTNQRFFGGKKNVLGMFVRVKHTINDDKIIKIPKKIADIPLRGSTMQMLDKLPYSKALDFEFLGVREHTIHFNIPYLVVNANKVDLGAMGEFMAFWHYVAVYSSWLRGVNPFDQPEVEFSKNHSFELRKNFKSRVGSER